MTINFANKYKDKKPTETIENVKQFFKEKNYTVDIVQIKEPISGIWWCNLELKYNGIKIAHSNGKGSTKDYALASGYSELYERYCNFSNNTFGQKINQEKLFELSLQKFGYRLFPDEKYISIKDLNSLPALQKFYNSINDDKDSFTTYLNSIYPEGLLALPFKGFNKNDVVNIPFQLLLLADGSSGMAAGNTIEEALTQGLSEICEHYVHQHIYSENRTFYYLDIDNMQLPNYLRNYFSEFTKKGYHYYVYDFSYLYQIPVLGLLIIDPIKHISYLNLGSAPNFYITLERCCTEMYQGYTILGDSLKKSMLPMRSINLNRAIETSLISMPLSRYYPDNLILNSQQVPSYNNKIFLNNNDYSNIQLNNYYQQIFNRKKWNVYYRDFSQSKNIKAVKCYVTNIPVMDTVADINNDTPIEAKRLTWEMIFKWNQLINDYVNNQKIDMNLFLEIQKIKKSEILTINNNVTFKYCFNFDFLHMPKKNSNNYLDFDILFSSLTTKNWNLIFEKSENFEELRNYLILILYAQHYTKQEIKIISNFYNVEYNDEELNNCNNLEYILNKIYFEPYYNYYYSNEYASIINSFIPLILDNK